LQALQKTFHLTTEKTLALGVILGFTFLYALFFLSTFPPDRLLAPGDGWRFFAPAFYAKKSLWLNLICTGYPQAADPQFQTWYPLAFIFQCFHSFNGFIFFAFVLASCFAFLFTYTLTRSKLAATISGICYGMSGFCLCHFEHASMIHAAIWIPLILTAIEKLSKRTDVFWSIIGSLAVCMSILGGHPQISVYGLGLSGIYALYAGLSEKQSGLKNYIAIIGIFVLGIGLAAIQIIPTLEWMHQSTRETMSYDRFSSHPIVAVAFWQLVYPNLCRTFCTEISCYVGILPLLLFFTAILCKQHNRHFLFWLFISILAVCLMLGDATPLAKFMYHLPIYNLFRGQGRHGLELTIAFSTLAGLIINHIEKTNDKKSLLKYGLVACGLLIILIVLGTYFAEPSLVEYAQRVGICSLNFNPLKNSTIGIPVILTLASIVSFLVWLCNTRALWRKALLIATFTFDMFLSCFLLSIRYPHFSLPEASIIHAPPPIAVYINKLLGKSHQRLFPLPSYGYMDLDLAMNGLAPNLCLFWNIPIASGYPIRFKRYCDLLRIGEFGATPLVFDPVGCEFDLASVKYVLYPNVKIADPYPNLINADRYKKIATFALCTIYENLHVMPRAWLTGEIIPLPADAVLKTIHSCRLPDNSHFNAARTALVEDALVPKITSGITNGAVQINTLTDTFEEFKTNCSKPTMLVVSDLFYPGWEAKVDGKRSKIYITDYAFRSVFVEAGEHKITCEYKPRSLYWGIVVSSLSLLILVLLPVSLRLLSFSKPSELKR
jgi:hypothetical protein